MCSFTCVQGSAARTSGGLVKGYNLSTLVNLVNGIAASHYLRNIEWSEPAPVGAQAIVQAGE